MQQVLIEAPHHNFFSGWAELFSPLLIQCRIKASDAGLNTFHAGFLGIIGKSCLCLYYGPVSEAVMDGVCFLSVRSTSSLGAFLQKQCADLHLTHFLGNS